MALGFSLSFHVNFLTGQPCDFSGWLFSRMSPSLQCPLQARLCPEKPPLLQSLQPHRPALPWVDVKGNRRQRQIRDKDRQVPSVTMPCAPRHLKWPLRTNELPPPHLIHSFCDTDNNRWILKNHELRFPSCLIGPRISELGKNNVWRATSQISPEDFWVDVNRHRLGIPPSAATTLSWDPIPSAQIEAPIFHQYG